MECLWRSVKYDEAHPKDYVDVSARLVGDSSDHNAERLHQALATHTPDHVDAATGQDGGARIVDRFGDVRNTRSATPSGWENRAATFYLLWSKLRGFLSKPLAPLQSRCG